jgi:hypothetical protein
MGFLLAEESACGLPVIATLHGKTGSLVDITAEEIGKSIIQTLLDNNFRNFGDEGKKNAAKLSWERANIILIFQNKKSMCSRRLLFELGNSI